MSEPTATPPAAPPAATPPAAPATPPATDWTTGFNDELKGYVQTKGFKDPASVTDAYRNLEKLHGVPHERMLKLPENMDTPEGRAIFERLGAPKDPKEYKLEIPKESGDPKMAETFAQLFSEIGVPVGQAQKIVGKWNELQASRTNEFHTNAAESVRQEELALKKEWGAAYDQNKQIGTEAAKKYGFDAGTIDKLQASMGFKGVMQFMHRLGTAVGEHNYIGGQQMSGFGNVMSPAQAKAQIAALKSDPSFGKKIMMKDAESITKLNRLHEMAYPGEQVLEGSRTA